MITKLEKNILLVLLSAAAVVGYTFILQWDIPNLSERIELHSAIVNGTALSPYKYRVLVPFVMQACISLSSAVVPYNTSFVLVYSLFEISTIALWIVLLYYYVRTWFGELLSAVGCLFVVCVSTLSLRDQYFQPWSFAELSIIILALRFSMQDKLLHLAVLTVVGTLIRETALFIPLIYAATHVVQTESRIQTIRINATSIKKSLLLLLLYVLSYGLLRIALGHAEHIHSLSEVFRINTTNYVLARVLIGVPLFMGIFWYYFFKGISFAPHFARMALGVVPIYILFILVFGVWNEFRLLMPLYVLFLPIALSYFQKKIIE